MAVQSGLYQAGTGNLSVSQLNRDAIASCLHHLCRVWLITLPLFRPIASLGQATIPTSPNSTSNVMSNVISANVSSSIIPLSVTLQYALDKVISDADMEDLIWTPSLMHGRQMAPSSIRYLQDRLREWLRDYSKQLPEQLVNPHSAIQSSQKFTDELKSDTLPIPSLPYRDFSDHSTCLAAAALYNFYMGRTMWALCILSDDAAEANESLAYFYFYEALRLTVSQLDNAITTSATAADSTQHTNHEYIPSEALKPGLLAMLHVIGQCSPRPSWLRWIIGLIRQIGQEGLVCGEALATSLSLLHTFEMYNNIDTLVTIPTFLAPTERVILVLIPEAGGRHYLCYYARPKPVGADVANDEPRIYEPVGHARWASSSADEGRKKPEVNIYGADSVTEPFTRDWLLKQPAACDWGTWSAGSDFDLDRAVHNHINGSRLLATP